jgi:tetratricopeptide (TPR) repeat protein
MYANAVSVTAAYGLTEDPAADLADAEAAACEALATDARNAHAHLCLATIALVRGQWDLAIQLAQQGARLGAGHPTMLATAGTVLFLAGAWADGVSVMRNALRLNPRHPGYMRDLFALERILAGDDSAALAEASLITATDAYWGPFYRALALAGLGYLEQARQEFAIAVSIEPALADDPASVLGTYANFTESQMAVLVDRVALIRDSGAADMPH